MPVYTWRDLTPEVVVSLFLYGQTTRPAALVDDALIRPNAAVTDISVDAASYMSDGPGRFANPAMSSLVVNFFGSASPLLAGNGTRREFDAAGMIAMVGGSASIAYQQYNFDDGRGDLNERTLIYNSSGFRIAEDARFVIEADGTRKVTNMAVAPFDDNYDFNSPNWAAILANGGGLVVDQYAC